MNVEVALAFQVQDLDEGFRICFKQLLHPRLFHAEEHHIVFHYVLLIDSVHEPVGCIWLEDFGLRQRETQLLYL